MCSPFLTTPAIYFRLRDDVNHLYLAPPIIRIALRKQEPAAAARRCQGQPKAMFRQTCLNITMDQIDENEILTTGSPLLKEAQ